MNRNYSLIILPLCVYTAVNMYVVQGVLTYISLVEVFVTGIKIGSSNQSPF